MEDIVIIVIITLIAFCFYLLIPGIGGLIVRDKLKRFRKRLILSSFFPIINYTDLHRISSGFIGDYRFFGNLEAIQGDNKIWLKSGTVTIAADLKGVPVYLIPSPSPYPENILNKEREFEETIPYQEALSVKWKRIFSLSEGTQIFISGSLFIENRQGIFKSNPKEPLLVVIYDGNKKDLLKRAVWYGRKKNEYWNQFTLLSLFTGFFSLLLCSYLLIRSPSMRIAALLSLNLSLLPITALLPPGVLLFFIYRTFWKKARYLRAERDLLNLPLRYFHSNKKSIDKSKILVNLPDNSTYIMIRSNPETSDNYIPVRGNVQIRMSSLHKSKKHIDKENYLFGSYYNNKNGDYITEPIDPMAELIQIPGNPIKMADECNRKSKMYAYLSGFCILFELIINFFLLFFLLQYFKW